MIAIEAAAAAVAHALSLDIWLKDPDAGKRSYLYNLMCGGGLNEQSGLTGEHPEEAIALAKNGDGLAHEALIRIARDLTSRGCPLPLKLQEYVITIVASPPKKRPGQHKVANLFRDEAIFRAVQVARSHGLNATRNPSSVGVQTACSLVADALGEYSMRLSESDIYTIWRGRAIKRRAGGFRDVRDPFETISVDCS